MESACSSAAIATAGHATQTPSPSGAALAVSGMTSGGSPSLPPPLAAPHSSAEPSYAALSVAHERSAGLHDDDSIAGEEMDMFDIELQREFQAGLGLTPQPNATTSFHGPRRCDADYAAAARTTFALGVNDGIAPPPRIWAQELPSAAAGLAPPCTSAALPLPGRTAPSTSHPVTIFSSPANATPPSVGPVPASSAEGFVAKHFSSVAGACQVSSVLQDREECVRVVRHLAEELRRELHLTAPATEQVSPRPITALSSLNPSPNAAVSFEEDLKLLASFVQDMQQSYHGAWRTPYSPGTAALPGHSGAAAPPPSAMARVSTVVSARTHTPSTSPTVAVVTNGGSGAGWATSHAAVGHVGRGHGGTPAATSIAHPTTQPPHRTSPAGGRAGATWMAATTTPPTGRSTIDAEVNDSLGRIELAHTQSTAGSLHEYEQRPINPYQGGPHGGFTTPRQVPQTQYPSHYAPGGHGGTVHNVAVNAVHVVAASQNGHTGVRAENSAPVALSLSAVVRRVNRSSSNGHSVAHPRAVKPGMSKGRSRGPRSQSGKNVAPSNHSAFSECSGGETRSYQSTVAGFHQNTSTNATTNTSMSSTVFRAHVSGAVEGNTTSSSNAGAMGTGPGGAVPVPACGAASGGSAAGATGSTTL